MKNTKVFIFLIRKVLKHWTKWNKKPIFNLFLFLMYHIRIFQFSLHRMRHLAKPHTFSHEVYSYIYIYIYIYLFIEKKYLKLWLKQLTIISKKYIIKVWRNTLHPQINTTNIELWVLINSISHRIRYQDLNSVYIKTNWGLGLMITSM